MVHIGTAAFLNPVVELNPFSDRLDPVRHAVLIVRDTDENQDPVDAICGFLEIGAEHASSADDLRPLLRGIHPIAIIADLDGKHQDGYHIMKTVAAYDPDLPVLLLTDGNPALLGAVDAIAELHGLTRVATVIGTSDIGGLVDFLCHAARDSGMTRLLRV